MKSLASTCAALACVLLLDTAAAGPGALHTDLSQVHACALLDRAQGMALGATDGGVVLVGEDLLPRAVWTALDGLPGTRTHALLREGDTFWIGSEHGIARIRPGGPKLEIIEQHRTDDVRALARVGRDLYIGTWGKGVLRLHDRALAPVPVHGQSGPSQLRVTDLVVMDGNLVVATAGNGLFRLEQGRMKPMVASLAGAMVWSLAVQGKVLWAGTVDGLYRIEGAEIQAKNQADVRDVLVSGRNLWLATFGQGIQHLDEAGIVRPASTPANAQFAYTYADQGGAACIGTHEGMWLRKGTSEAWRKAAITSVPSSDIAALAVDGERLWVGTFDRGLAVYERGTWRQIKSELIDPKINALVVENGRLWVATSAGLSLVQGDRIARLDDRDGLPSRHVLSLARLRDGGILAGTARGAVVVRDGAVTAMGRKQKLYISNVWAVAEDSAGWLWLGTTKGLYRGRAGQSWERYSVATGHLRDDWVMAITVRGNALFIGTYKGGVTRLEPVQNGYQATNLADGWVNPGGMAWVGDTLYVATMDGLLKGNGTSWQAHESPVPGRDITAVAHQSQGSRLWIATRRGLLGLDMP